MGIVCGTPLGFAQPPILYLPFPPLQFASNLYHVTMICFWGALTTSHRSLLLYVLYTTLPEKFTFINCACVHLSREKSFYLTLWGRFEWVRWENSHKPTIKRENKRVVVQLVLAVYIYNMPAAGIATSSLRRWSSPVSRQCGPSVTIQSTPAGQLAYS